MKKLDDKIENLEKEVKYHIIELEENVDEHISPIIEDTKNQLAHSISRIQGKDEGNNDVTGNEGAFI